MADMYSGPAGATEAGTRSPFDEGTLQAKDLGVMGPSPALRAEPPPHTPPGTDERDPGRQLRDPEIAWRPIAVYVGAVSADMEAGLVSPPMGGITIYRAGIRIRTDHDADTTDYWRFELVLRAPDEQVVAELTTETNTLTAHLFQVIWSEEVGIKMQEDHEMTLRVVAVGSPSALVGLQVNGDLRAGV